MLKRRHETELLSDANFTDDHEFKCPQGRHSCRKPILKMPSSAGAELFESICSSGCESAHDLKLEPTPVMQIRFLPRNPALRNNLDSSAFAGNRGETAPKPQLQTWNFLPLQGSSHLSGYHATRSVKTSISTHTDMVGYGIDTRALVVIVL